MCRACSSTSQLGTGLANVEIRGIAQGSQGAATTGFYLDDTPISKRNVGGGVATSNGTPLPPLFDLQRVEVLRGPQGTLYGSGSEGGTVRYITPDPDLNKYEFLCQDLGLDHPGWFAVLGCRPGGGRPDHRWPARLPHELL